MVPRRHHAPNDSLLFTTKALNTILDDLYDTTGNAGQLVGGMDTTLAAFGAYRKLAPRGWPPAGGRLYLALSMSPGTA